MLTPAIRNEQIKMLATAVNNLGVACIVTGAISPLAGYFLGVLQIEDPLRLLSFIMICVVTGVSLLLGAQRILKDLQ